MKEKEKEKEWKVMPWLRKVREKLSEEYYKNPEKYKADLRKIKPPKGVTILK